MLPSLGGEGRNNGAGEEKWGFGAILGKKLTVLNMTQCAFYHLIRSECTIGLLKIPKVSQMNFFPIS